MPGRIDAIGVRFFAAGADCVSVRAVPCGGAPTA